MKSNHFRFKALEEKGLSEKIRINKNKLSISVKTIRGKDGDHYVMISPTLLVSGYGNTEEEAKESFIHNMEVFCEDLMSVNQEKRENYIVNLGFNKEKLRNKNFTQPYIDKSGVLIGIEEPVIETLETV
jgi:hypothetical protein